MDVYLRAKFEVSIIILTSFRRGVILPLPPPTSKRIPKKPTQIRDKNHLRKKEQMHAPTEKLINMV